jgi:hypothetical protein
MLFIYEMSFFKSFKKQLIFLIGGNLLSSNIRQSLSNIYRDLKSNLYSTKVISLMVAMLSALSLAIQDVLMVKHVLMQQCLFMEHTFYRHVLCPFTWDIELDII